MKQITIVVEKSTDYTPEGQENTGTNFLTVLLHHRTNGIFGKSGFPTKYYVWGEEQTPGEVIQIDLDEFQIQHQYKVKKIEGKDKLCHFKTLVHLSIAPDVNPMPERSKESLMTEFPQFFQKEIAEKAKSTDTEELPF